MPPRAAAAEAAPFETASAPAPEAPKAPVKTADLGGDQALKDFEAHSKTKRRGRLGAAPKTPLDVELPEGLVRVRILPYGDDKVYTGAMDPSSLTDKFPRHRRGETVVLPIDVAEAQGKKGHVEIME